MREISSKLGSSDLLKKNQKKVMPFVSGIKNEFELNGLPALENESPIEQWEILDSFKDYIRQTLNLNSLQMVAIDETNTDLSEQVIDKCGPMHPLITFET